jgi:hypothetical protein
MVEPVIINVQTVGAEKSKRVLDSTARSVDRLDAVKRKTKTTTDANAQSIRRETAEVERYTRAARAAAMTSAAAPQRGTGMATAGRALTGAGGAVGRLGGPLASMAAGGPGAAIGVLTTAIAVGTQAFMAADQRRVQAAEQAARKQIEIAELNEQIRKSQQQQAVGLFRQNQQNITRLRFQLGPEGVSRAQALQREGFETAPGALLSLQRFSEGQREVVLSIARAVSQIGGGTLQDIVESFTPAMARRAEREPDAYSREFASRRLGVPLTREQSAIVGRLRYHQGPGPYADIDQLRRVSGTVAAEQLGMSVNVPRVEGGLRAELSTLRDPLNAALAELGRLKEQKIRILEAEMKAESSVARFLRDTAFGGGSAQRRFGQEVGGVTP